MKSFLKTNIVLVVGVALPLLLMAFFYVAQRASVAGIDPPGYDAVIAVDYHDRWTDYPYRIGVDEGKLVVRYRPGADGKSRRSPGTETSTSSTTPPTTRDCWTSISDRWRTAR